MMRNMLNFLATFFRIVFNGTHRRISFFLTYYVRCRADSVEYLRFLGARIGHGCSIYTTPHNFGTEPWLIEIGNNVTLGQGVLLITHDGTSRLFRDCLPGMSPFGNRFSTIVIRDNCFIGDHAILLPGVEIGPDSAVGAGSVVTKTVPPRTIVAGNPARPIKTLDEYIEGYPQRMIPLEATDRDTLRKELTTKLWGHER
jgi:acetyltransferase-like isoleucine patch superfamily enzyme